MRTKTVGKALTHSIVYGYAVTQPFAFFSDAQPIIQDKLLAETEGIQYGEHAEIVRHLQYKLTKLGAYEDAIDGVFGLLTEHAIKGFQSSYELQVTGQADKETMKMLIKQEIQVEIDQIKDFIYDIEYGAQNTKVSKVQEVLFFHGYYHGAIDGIYGPLTENAIQQIQSEGLIDTNDYQSSSDVPISLLIEETKEKTNETTVNSTETHDIVQLKVATNTSSIIQTAKSYIGTPYVWGGTSPSGFDCSGFIQFIYGQSDMLIPRTVNEIWNFTSPLDSPAIGDLVFFETYQPGPSHLGIYLGNGEFIHAGSSNGVTISNLNEDDYWKDRYLGAKRVY